ncbi:MAG: GSCFA domain-containing protein [Tannerella sp.]|jgi:hypothetical protein|nr:GSCFA domain-containing protein [Tannerella sp.]
MIPYTKIETPEYQERISYGTSLMAIGSCFAESIGGALLKNKFDIDVNPFGVIYNPSSVAQSLKMLIHNDRQTKETLFLHDGLYHSFNHHSRFSDVSQDECLRKINERLAISSANIRKISYLLITFGTAWIYRRKDTGQTVANCHKLPEQTFERSRLTVSEITREWKALLSELRSVNSAVKVIFTVSPVRHLKDGAIENQRSKATLLLAVGELCASNPDVALYFPAYEIMMDELRDYRFYADDMLHPSEMAVRHIYNRFAEAFMDDETRELTAEVVRINKLLEHRPVHPTLQSYNHFTEQLTFRTEQLKQKTPYICFDKEMEEAKRFFGVHE